MVVRWRQQPHPALTLLVCCAALLCCTPPSAHAASVYKGCWEDRGPDSDRQHSMSSTAATATAADTTAASDDSPNDHALPLVQLVPFERAVQRTALDRALWTRAWNSGGDGVTHVTVASCIQTCDMLGFAYTGLNGGDSCFCGHDPPRYKMIDNRHCDRMVSVCLFAPAFLFSLSPPQSRLCSAWEAALSRAAGGTRCRCMVKSEEYRRDLTAGLWFVCL
jgi:hypothetical protein